MKKRLSWNFNLESMCWNFNSLWNPRIMPVVSTSLWWPNSKFLCYCPAEQWFLLYFGLLIFYRLWWFGIDCTQHTPALIKTKFRGSLAFFWFIVPYNHWDTGISVKNSLKGLGHWKYGSPLNRCVWHHVNGAFQCGITVLLGNSLKIFILKSNKSCIRKDNFCEYDS